MVIYVENQSPYLETKYDNQRTSDSDRKKTKRLL
jgi:hypothetical protein